MDNPAYIGAKSKKSNPMSNGKSGRGSTKTFFNCKCISLCLLCAAVLVILALISSAFLTYACGTPESPEHGSAYKDGLSAKFTCDEGFSLVGDLAADCLFFYGRWSKPTPTCIPKCGVPVAPKYGTVKSEGLSAVFDCNDGFKVVGESKSECLSSGSWSNPRPTCRLVCKMPIEPTDGTITAEGSILTFRCDDGFRLVGTSTVQCLSDGTWTNPSPACEFRCEVPTELKDGTIRADGSTVAFACQEGFSLEGASTAQCLNNGTWTDPVPTCVLSCEMPTELKDGTVTTSGSTVTFACDEGFSLVGESTAQCLSNGILTNPVPTCILSCEMPTAPKDGTVTSDGLFVVFRCDRGFSLMGSSTSQCHSDGTWSNPAPICIFKCRPLTPPNYGTLSDEGVTVTFRCDDGFSLVGATASTCLDDGNWSNYPPTCRLSCYSLSSPQDGRIFVTGKTATFVCNPGYYLSHNQKLICQKSGTWSNLPPACIKRGISKGGRTTGNWIMVLACLIFVFEMAKTEFQEN